MQKTTLSKWAQIGPTKKSLLHKNCDAETGMSRGSSALVKENVFYLAIDISYLFWRQSLTTQPKLALNSVLLPQPLQGWR